MTSINSLTSDNEKRGKLLFLSALISLFMFVTKITQVQSQETILNIYLTSAIYFVASFLGLLWAFNFQVKKQSFLYLLQSSLFVFSEVLFIEFFFFQKFNRIYEAFLLLILLFLVFLGNYGSFLMANVFNVNLFKKIPLVHVGRTTSYVLSLLMLYFLSFSFLGTGLPIYLLLPIFLVVLFFIVLVHYMNIGLEQGELFRKTFFTVFVVFCLFLGSFLLGTSHEIISVVPVVGLLVCVSVVSQETMNNEVRFGSFIYIAVIVFVFLLNLLLNIIQ